MMWILSAFLCTVLIPNVLGAVHSDPYNIIQQGLYRQSDHVVILAQSNFDKKVYGRNHAWIIQFYNSFCGHCKAFSPRYKALALDILNWKKAVQLGVVDCSEEENIGLCREFEVLAYPSLRYLHENYAKANGNVGKQLHITDTVGKLKTQLIEQLQGDMSSGYLRHIPKLGIESYASLSSAIAGERNNLFTFLVFENENSTIGSELILDTIDYEGIATKRVYDTSELTSRTGVTKLPAIVAVYPNLQFTLLTPKFQTKESFLNAINSFLRTKQYVFPDRDLPIDDDPTEDVSPNDLIKADVIYYSDLEKTIRTSLHTEVVRYKILEKDVLRALVDYLNILILNFPFKANGRRYMTALRDHILTRKRWSGSDLFEAIKRLEDEHSPVYSSDLKYVSCRGSQSRYRGYTCGLWSLFHTLTVNAAPNTGPMVLKAMHGYVKNFFGCTECSQHFQAMAAKNRLFDVQDNDKAVLWLWISHNEVNLRLAGDITEDPAFPKIQFPSTERCFNCRLVHGAWNLTAVYHYLQSMYGAHNIEEHAPVRSSASNVGPLSAIDIYMLSLL